MLADFSLSIDYAQLVVRAESRVGQEFLWTDDDVAQGFVWSQGAVAFGAPDHDGECRVQVALGQVEAVDAQALWAVQTPFAVDEPLQIGALFDTRRIDVAPGSYNLICEAFRGDGDHGYLLRLTFSRSDAPQFKILKKGGDITADRVSRPVAGTAG